MSRRALAMTLLTASAVGGSAFATPAGASSLPSVNYVAVVATPDGGLTVSEFAASSALQFSAGLQDVSEAGDIVSLEVDHPVHALETRTAAGADPLRATQWALDATTFEAAWPRTTGAGAVVAVLDSGVKADHADLAGQVLPGYDVVADTPGGTTDIDGHGTHVAGIIAAAAGNGVGIAGAAPGVKILPVRVLDETGSGTLADIQKGIIWAADHGADVINLSLGGNGNANSYKATIQYANTKGAVVVAASGNNALEGNTPRYPAADPQAVAVGSVTSVLLRSLFSNYGPQVDLAAPGSSILSTVPTGSGFSSWSGTSMATPFVAAAAALVAAARPDWSAAQVRDALERSAQDLGPAGRDDEFGAGLVDPRAALAFALGAPATPPVPGGGGAAPPAPAGTTAPTAPTGPVPASGYWVVSADGRVDNIGTAPDFGDLAPLGGGTRLAAPIVAAASTPSGHGYWLTGADGAVFPFGDAASLGSLAGLRLGAPIVGMAPTASGQGYWLLGQDGGVFAFGDAGFFGSTGGIRLNQPVVDMAPTPSGRGYWLVASDGGVFAFGDAAFRGSTGNIRLNQPIVSLTPAATGGYWMVASDGGIFAFDVPFHGSLPSLGRTDLPAGQRIRATAGGAGYYILGADGRVFSFGVARDLGSTPVPVTAVDLLLAP